MKNKKQIAVIDGTTATLYLAKMPSDNYASSLMGDKDMTEDEMLEQYIEETCNVSINAVQWGIVNDVVLTARLTPATRKSTGKNTCRCWAQVGEKFCSKPVTLRDPKKEYCKKHCQEFRDNQ